MSFDIAIKVDPASSEQKIAGVERALDKLEAKGEKVGPALTRGIRESSTAYEKAKSPVDVFSRSLDHEREILERIHGPMLQLERDVQALDALHRKGAISAKQYADALGKSRSAAGVGDPTSAISLPGGLNMKALQTDGQKVIGHLSGELMAMAGPAAAAAAGISAISEALERLDAHNRMIANATNQMLRFHDSVGAARDAVGEQVEASKILGVTVHEQIEAFDAVSDASEHLQKTHGQLMDMTRNLSMVMIHQGKSMSDVGVIMSTMQLGMEKGSLEARELKGIIKEYPEAADMMAKSLGTTRDGMLTLAKSGQFTAEKIAIAMRGFEDGSEVSKVFGERQLDINKVMEDQHVGWVKATEIVLKHKSAVEEMTKAFDPYEAKLRKINEALNGVILASASMEDKLNKADVKFVQDSFGAIHRKNLKAVTDGLKAYNDGLAESEKRLAEIKRLSDGWAKSATDDLVKQLESEVESERGRTMFDDAGISDMSTSISSAQLGATALAAAAEDYEASIQDVHLAAAMAVADHEAMQAKIFDTTELMASAFGSMEDALVGFALTGKFSFSGMVDSMLADLTRLIAKQLMAAALSKLIGGGSTNNPVAAIAPLTNLFQLGFATGGSFMVGGKGGTDTTPVSFMASPGERVTVETPAEVMTGSQQSGPAAAPRIQVINSFDRRELLQALDSPEGATVVHNIIRKNPGLLKR